MLRRLQVGPQVRAHLAQCLRKEIDHNLIVMSLRL